VIFFCPADGNHERIRTNSWTTNETEYPQFGPLTIRFKEFLPNSPKWIKWPGELQHGKSKDEPV
jgi:hypothetical protein